MKLVLAALALALSAAPAFAYTYDLPPTPQEEAAECASIMGRQDALANKIANDIAKQKHTTVTGVGRTNWNKQEGCVTTDYFLMTFGDGMHCQPLFTVMTVLGNKKTTYEPIAMNGMNCSYSQSQR